MHWSRGLRQALVMITVVIATSVGRAQTAPQASTAVTPADLSAAINQLGAFDFGVRMTASRTVRRAPSTMAVPALVNAVRTHADTFVQYRALVLLAGFDDPATPQLIRTLMTDRNDRLRAVAYAWWEHHPSPDVVPQLVDALKRELSEFVRPSLTRALAAQRGDRRALNAVLPLVSTGEDFFRGEVIQALGDYRATTARESILAVAKLDGPLRDDAILALGKIGDPSVLEVLAQLQRSVARERQPAIAAALCMLAVNCETQQQFLSETLRFAADTAGFQLLLRSTARALGELAARGNVAAATTLLDAGVPAGDASRAPIALAIGAAAVRSPETMLAAIATSSQQARAIELLRDAFDMLEEDFEEELFYVEVRRIYWASAEGSAPRRVAEAVIQKLEF